MNIQIVRLEASAAQLWRNGGGVTRELLAWPDATDWLVRLSVADIERDGPFSAFPGIDRWIAVLAGRGTRLGINGALRDLVVGDAPLPFDGGIAVDCELVDGPTRDLNLMLRREHARGWLRRVESVPGAAFEWPAGDSGGASKQASVRGVFTAGGCTLRHSAEERLMVPPMSLAWKASVPGTDRWQISELPTDSVSFAFQCDVVATNGGVRHV